MITSAPRSEMTQSLLVYCRWSRNLYVSCVLARPSFLYSFSPRLFELVCCLTECMLLSCSSYKRERKRCVNGNCWSLTQSSSLWIIAQFTVHYSRTQKRGSKKPFGIVWRNRLEEEFQTRSKTRVESKGKKGETRIIFKFSFFFFFFFCVFSMLQIDVIVS